MTPAPAKVRVSAGLKVAYGLPAFALAVIGIPVYVHIPKFYSDVIGVDIAVIGTILLAVRVFDAVSDPLIGLLSDQTRTRFGRRRPYILLGGICVAAATCLLFVPPRTLAGNAADWFGFSIFTVFLFWTITTVPYEALGPEVTSDYSERTGIFVVRDGLFIAGTLLAAASPVLIAEVLQLGSGSDAERRKFFWMAAGYAPMLIGFCLWCALRVKERPAPAARLRASSRRQLHTMFRNRPFLILLGAYTISAFGSNLPATLILYYVEYVLHSENADLFLFLYFAAGVVMLPVWLKLAQKWGKKKAWLLSMVVNTLAFSGVFFLGPGDEIGYGVLVLLSGFGFGATLALPSAIQADVIDYDELLSGQRQEGWYIGIWSVAKKLAAALGVGVGLTVLGAVGYQPNSAQPDQVVMALRVLYALVPCACNIVAMAIAVKFPISQQVHQEILEQIARKQQGHAAANPLEKHD